VQVRVGICMSPTRLRRVCSGMSQVRSVSCAYISSGSLRFVSTRKTKSNKEKNGCDTRPWRSICCCGSLRVSGRDRSSGEFVYEKLRYAYTASCVAAGPVELSRDRAFDLGQSQQFCERG
jgi:hypothetical protein